MCLLLCHSHVLPFVLITKKVFFVFLVLCIVNSLVVHLLASSLPAECFPRDIEEDNVYQSHGFRVNLSTIYTSIIFFDTTINELFRMHIAPLYFRCRYILYPQKGVTTNTALSVKTMTCSEQQLDLNKYVLSCFNLMHSGRLTV